MQITHPCCNKSAEWPIARWKCIYADITSLHTAIDVQNTMCMKKSKVQETKCKTVSSLETCTVLACAIAPNYQYHLRYKTVQHIHAQNEWIGRITTQDWELELGRFADGVGNRVVKSWCQGHDECFGPTFRKDFPVWILFDLPVGGATEHIDPSPSPSSYTSSRSKPAKIACPLHANCSTPNSFQCLCSFHKYRLKSLLQPFAQLACTHRRP